MTNIKLKTYFKDSNLIHVGTDESGRGALSGCLTVAACIMPHGFEHPLIKDSKLLNEQQRKDARKIVEEYAIAYSIVHIQPKEIEDTNILKSTMIGMQRSLSNVYSKVKFDFILVDGDQFHGFEGIPYETIIGGDNKYVSIAAASILAKTERDSIMKDLDIETPGYGWNSNKGYGTAAHITAIKKIGPSKHHRISFISHLLNETVSLF